MISAGTYVMAVRILRVLERIETCTCLSASQILYATTITNRTARGTPTARIAVFEDDVDVLLLEVGALTD